MGHYRKEFTRHRRRRHGWSDELWIGSGLDINQYWEQRDACDQSNLLVGCFNNEYASSWLTAFSARVLFRVEELRLVVPTENSVFADLSTINRAIAWLVDERHILPSKWGIHGHNGSHWNIHVALDSPWIPGLSVSRPLDSFTMMNLLERLPKIQSLVISILIGRFQLGVWLDNQNKSLSAFTLATLIEVTKCGRRPIVYEDPKTLKQKTVDPKKVIRDGFDCFKDGFEGNSYLAVMVFRLGRFRSFESWKHLTTIILTDRTSSQVYLRTSKWD